MVHRVLPDLPLHWQAEDMVDDDIQGVEGWQIGLLISAALFSFFLLLCLAMAQLDKRVRAGCLAKLMTPKCGFQVSPPCGRLLCPISCCTHLVEAHLPCRPISADCRTKLQCRRAIFPGQIGRHIIPAESCWRTGARATMQMPCDHGPANCG